jgi:heterotetrameric sarcosine oxidase delta subunit
MQRLHCAHCGPRALEEWVHGEIFDLSDRLVDADNRDIDRAYMHNNTAGLIEEAWFHLYGCRRWQTFRRDTTTDLFV